MALSSILLLLASGGMAPAEPLPAASLSAKALRKASEQVLGVWFVGGNREKQCAISRVPEGLKAENESGQVSRLLPAAGHEVVAADWEGGVHGTVLHNRILWRNGTWWARERLP